MKALLFIICAFVSLQSFAAQLTLLTGHVTEATDGDTLTFVSDEGREIEVRLLAIDAPETSCHRKKYLDCVEKAQPGGKEARHALVTMTVGKRAQLVLNGDRTYNRYVGKVIVDGQDVALPLISNGLVWHYSQYAKRQEPRDRALYAELQRKARLKGVGIWSQRNPIEPSKWRRLKKGN